MPTNILMELGWNNRATYAEVFDYLAEKGLLVSISRYYDFADKEGFGDGYEFCVDCENTLRTGLYGDGDTWIEAANYAILACVDYLDEE